MLRPHPLLLSSILVFGLLALAPEEARAQCGNGTCEAPETAITCAQDCHWACGDAVCSFGEDHGNCAVDCPDPTCGNGTCDVPENAATCFGDCHYACGDGLCGCGETNANCPGDCPDATCGSGFCETPENATTCSDDCAFACGNGSCDAGEDFGNCEVDCPGSTCGDAICQPWEDNTSCPVDCIDNCGDGFCSNSAALGFENGSNCPADCPSPTCGDGFCINGEVHQTCSVDCPNAQCGDTTCSPGEGEDCYTCGFDCGVCTQLCGDGLLQAPEECDDGDTTSGDGCSDVCVIEECGDTITQAGIGEQCDDGGTLPDDGCTALCKTEYCGDIYTQPGIGEVCDNDSILCTTASGYPGTQACKSDCTGFEATCTTRLTCGDGICTFPPESGNPADGGYCPQDCAPQVSECVTFNGEAQCQSACGDGVVTGTETCDDGNTDSLDGCSAECQPDTVPALPLVDLGTVNGGDFDDNGQLEGADIQAALDTSCGTGCILELPAVTYDDVEVTIPSSITNGLVIRGQGMDLTVLKAPVPHLDHILHVVFNNAFTVVQKMTLDGQKQFQTTFDYNYSPSGLRAGWAPPDVGPGRIEQVKLKNFVRHGAVIRHAKDWIFNHNIAHDIGCADDTPCPAIDLPYLPQNLYPQMKSTGWGVIYVQAGSSGAWAHHNTMWKIKKLGIEAFDVIYDYRFNNNFLFSSRGAIVSNSGGGLRGLVSHNYVERTQDEAIQTRTGDTTIHNNLIVDNYGVGIIAMSRDHNLYITDNTLEHDCKHWGTNGFSISREGATGDGAVISGNDLLLADNCSNPVYLRRDNMLVENNTFRGGRPDQWVMIMDDMCNAEVKHTTLFGTPSQTGFHVNKAVENLEATVNFNAIDVTTDYTVSTSVNVGQDNINISMNDDYHEAADGDLSGDHLSPTFIHLEAGSNLVTASQQGDAFGRDVDYVTVTVPAGMVISAIQIENWSGNPASPAFIGLQSGTSFTVDAQTAQNSDLLGGASYAGPSANILTTMGALPGATGFLPPLFAGDYTFWLDQTGDPSTATLDFVMSAQATGPEIAVWGMSEQITDGATATKAGNGTYFGDPGVGGGGAAHVFTVANVGTLPLSPTSVTVTGPDAGDFTVSGFTPGPLAASGGTTQFTVTFDPAAAGERAAALEIASDDPDENPFDFALAGGPLPTPVPAPARGLGALVLAAAILGLGFAASRRAAR